MEYTLSTAEWLDVIPDEVPYMNSGKISDFLKMVSQTADTTVAEAATVVGQMRDALTESLFRDSPLADKWTWDDVSAPF
ncbi:MAG TPA: hypothetical protein VK427_14515 [Kofleriaceae bacterium]|nr:hypothetical protein [Kofleriaceae bacterium]